MKTMIITATASLLLSLAACDSSPQAQQSDAGAEGASEADVKEAQTYSATGTITELKGSDVTISHDPVAEIGWPAMTMTFRAEQPELLASVRTGDKVSFEFSQAGDGATLTSLKKL